MSRSWGVSGPGIIEPLRGLVSDKIWNPGREICREAKAIHCGADRGRLEGMEKVKLYRTCSFRLWRRMCDGENRAGGRWPREGFLSYADRPEVAVSCKSRASRKASNMP